MKRGIEDSNASFLPGFSAAKSTNEGDKTALITALEFLSDENTLNSLTFSDMLGKVSENAVIVDSVLTSLVTQFNKEDFVDLARNNSTLALKMAKNPEVYKLNKGDLFILSLYHLDVAHYLLDDPTRCAELSPVDLHNLADKHHDIAKKILERPDLHEKLNGGELAQLGYYHLDIARQIFETFSLRQRLELRSLCTLGAKHPSIAKKILEDKALREKLVSDDLAFLGSNLETAKIIFATPDLYSRISHFHLAYIGTRCPELVPQLVGKVPFNSTELMVIGASYASSAKIILGNFALSNLLSERELALMVKDHADLSLDVVKNSEFWSELEEGSLALLGEKNEKVALEILSNPRLRTKLSGNTLAFFGSKYESVAKRVFSEPGLRDKLNAYNLKTLGLAYIGSAKHILATPRLHEQLSQEQISALNRNITIASSIQNVAKEMLNKTPAVDMPNPDGGTLKRRA